MKIGNVFLGILFFAEVGDDDEFIVMYCVEHPELNLINSAFVDVKLLSDYVMDKRIIVEDTGDRYTAALILGKPSMEL